MKYDRNLSISEGEVPPEWYMSNQRDKEAPLDLSPLDSEWMILVCRLDDFVIVPNCQ